MGSSPIFPTKPWQEGTKSRERGGLSWDDFWPREQRSLSRVAPAHEGLPDAKQNPARRVWLQDMAVDPA